MTRQRVTALAAVFLCPLLLPAADPVPLVYLPFDRDGVVGIGRLDDATVLPIASDAHPGGVRGECLHIASDLRLPSVGNFNVTDGTVAFWIRADWQDPDKGHTLFCLYGGEDPTWAHNRWSIWANGDRVAVSLYPKAGGDRVAAETETPVADGQWHHIAWTWHGINSDQDNAELVLYVDGMPATRRADLRVTVGKIGPRIDIGRDSDGSPDYADAEYDELYIYPMALSADVIHHAVQRRRQTADVSAGDAGRRSVPSSLTDAARDCRFGIDVELPAGPAGPVTARVPLGIESDLAQLGLAGTPRTGSLILRDADSHAVIPHAVEGRDLLLSLTTDGTERSRRLVAAFGLSQYDFSVPLVARRRTAPTTPSNQTAFTFADYAQTAYGDAWDFDEGDDEDIDQWGNKPSFVKNRRVEDGILKMTVTEDPWFAWGNLWGGRARLKRPVAIDLEQFNLLEMRVKQSCPSAEWTVFGLPVGGTLKHHAFRVEGSGWQIVRVDLREEARFHGTLAALRIDPTNHLKDIDVEIDWIRITRTVAGRREAIQVAPTSEVPPAEVTIDAGARQVRAGSERVVAIRAVDAAGEPVSGWPVHIAAVGPEATLCSAPGAPSLEMTPSVRRAITGADGRTTVTVRVSPQAGTQSTELAVTPEFTKTAKASVAWDTLAGPPHHYRVTPPHACVVHEQELPLTVTAQLVDEHDNPLTEAGRRVSLKTLEAMSVTPANVVTDDTGKAEFRLTFDLSKRWVGAARVIDEQGLEGQSAPISVALDTPLPFTYRVLPNGYFATSDGKPFVPLGGFYANWVQSETPNGEWDQCSPFHATTDAEKRLWLSKLAENGVTALRFMLRTHRREPGMDGTEGLDAGGRVNRRLFSEILRYMDLAREFNIVFLAVVHDDYYKPIYYDRNNHSKFVRPAFAGVDLDALPEHQRRFVRDGRLLDDSAQKYTDPDAIACQDMYARELTRFVKNCPAIFAYELENEMVNCPAQWANHAVAVLREGDPDRPVCVSHGGGGMMTADPLWWHRKTDIDFYTYHLYPHSNKCTTPEMDYGLATDVLTRYGRMSGASIPPQLSFRVDRSGSRQGFRPATSFYGESSGDQFRDDKNRERRRWVMRDLIWISLTNGNPGCFFWNARLSEVAEFAAARDAMSRLDLLTFQRATPPIAVVVSHPLEDDKYYRTEKGRVDYEMMGRYCRHYQQLAVDFDFTVDPQGYAQVADLTAFAPPEPSKRPLRTPTGLATTYLAREDWSEALIYVRNLAGIEPVELKHGRGISLQHLRTRQVLDWQLKLDLPKGIYDLHIYDLDTRETTDVEVSNDGTITLGKTDHDVAVVMKRHD